MLGGQNWVGHGPFPALFQLTCAVEDADQGSASEEDSADSLFGMEEWCITVSFALVCKAYWISSRMLSHGWE